MISVSVSPRQVAKRGIYRDENQGSVQSVQERKRGVSCLGLAPFGKVCEMELDSEDQKDQNERLLNADTGHVDVQTFQDIACRLIIAARRTCSVNLDDQSAV